jgi:hypothetical protein
LDDETVPPAKFLGEKNDTRAGLVVSPDTGSFIVMYTLPLGMDSGAVYTPDDVIVPEAAEPPTTPLTFHELVSTSTVALNCTLCPASRRTAFGVTLNPAG